MPRRDGAATPGQVLAAQPKLLYRSRSNHDCINDGRYFCHAFGLDEQSGWMFHEWREWFYMLTEEVSAVEDMHMELAKLSLSGNRISPGPAFEVAEVASRSLEDRAWDVFVEMVKIPIPPGASPFDLQFEDVLQASGLARNPKMHRNIQVEIFAPTQPILLPFEAFLEGEHAIGIKGFKIRGRSASKLAARLDEIRATFLACTEHGILSRDRCVVLHDGAARARSRYIDQLENVATVIPMSSADASARLEAVFEGQSDSLH